MNDAAIGEERGGETDERNNDVIDPFGLQRIEDARRQIAAEESARVREVVHARA